MTTLGERYSVWSNCPLDLLILIYKFLNIESLPICLKVNKHWKDVCIYYCDRYHLWNKLIKTCLNNNGINYRQKSILNDKELFLNAILWEDVSKSKVVIKNYYQYDFMKHIHVYKDVLIVVCDKSVKFLDINTFTLKKTLDIECSDYRESTNYIIILFNPSHKRDNYILKINKKDICKCSGVKCSFLIPKTSFYSLDESRCYFFDETFTLWAYYPECGHHLRMLGKYYGNREIVHSVNALATGIYVLLQNGNVLCVDETERKISLKFRVITPGFVGKLTPYVFDRFTFVYGTDNSDISDNAQTLIFGENCENSKVLVLRNLSTAAMHDDIILAGFND